MVNKKLSDRLKDSLSFRDLDGYSRKHSTEIFTAIALAIAAISSSWDFFTGPKLSIFMFVFAAIVGIFFPAPVQTLIKKMWGFFNVQEKTTQLVLDGARIVVAIFVPFLLLGAFGLLAGLSFHYYTNHFEHPGKGSHKSSKSNIGDEHD